MGRNILAVVAGLITGMILIAAIEYVGHQIYPLPEGLDMHDPDAIRAYLETAPTGSLWMVILAYAIGAFDAGLVSSVIARQDSRRVALICGLFLLAFGLINLFLIPHPAWFWVLSLAVFLPSAYLGSLLGNRPKIPQ